MTDNVTAMPGCKVPTSEPNQALITALEKVLEQAKDGRLQSFVGTGFHADGQRLAVWCIDRDPDVYRMSGSLAWLQSEYIHRKSQGTLA